MVKKLAIITIVLMLSAPVFADETATMNELWSTRDIVLNARYQLEVFTNNAFDQSPTVAGFTVKDTAAVMALIQLISDIDPAQDKYQELEDSYTRWLGYCVTLRNTALKDLPGAIETFKANMKADSGVWNGCYMWRPPAP